MKQEHTLSTRIIALFLSTVMILGMMPTGAVFAVDADSYGVVESISSGVTVTGGDTAAPVATISAQELVWAPADPSVGRMNDGWWVGIKITAPETMTKKEHFEVDAEHFVAYQRLDGEVWTANKSFWNAQDSNKNSEDTARYLTLWGMVNEEFLRSANQKDKNIEYKWQFDWNMDGTFEQVVTLSIDPENMVLKNQSGTQVFPVEEPGYGTVSTLTGGMSVSGSGTDTVMVTYTDKAVLHWVEKNDAVGRYQDGWWAGLQINVPAGMTEDQVRAAYYTSGASAAKSFWTYKDSVEGAASHYLTMWVPLNNLQTGTMDPYTWKFDWNGDGLYEQTVTLEVDASKIVLLKDGTTIVPSDLGYGKLETLSSGLEITDNETAAIAVRHNVPTTIDWVAADNSVGRYQDGWWAGVKITVPAGMTEEQVKNIKYKSGETEKSFWASKDSQEGAGDQHYLTMWAPLNALLTGDSKPYTWSFDWNNDGVYDQTVTLEIDPENIVLTQNGQTMHPAPLVGYGTMESISGGLTITNNGTESVTVSNIGKTVLNWSAADASVGRYQDGWWVGVKITVPAGMTEDQVKKANYTSGASGEKSFWDYKDSAEGVGDKHYLTMWVPLNGLLTGTVAPYTWNFDWNGDHVCEQTVTLNVDPDEIVLMKNGETVYPSELGYGTMSALTGGMEITGNGTASVTIRHNNMTTLGWVAADPSVGRNKDGWWVGVQINVPAGMTEAQLKHAAYTSGASGEKSFWTYKDSQEGDASHYLTMWVPVNGLLSGTMDPYVWTFDWDNDGTFEQTVTLEIDGQYLQLTKDGVQVYPSYGTLESLTGSVAITGNTTENVTIRHNAKTTLHWVAKDPSVGRNEDGWWVGVQINAPVGLDESILRNAVFTNGGSGAKSFWAFKDSVEGAQSHYLTMWVSVNGLMTGSVDPYTWTFDWNNDGVYEQTVTLEIDPEMLVLIQDGVQLYPTLGTVSTYTGGTVTGSGTGNVTVVVDEVTLEWSPADPSIGRNQDSWWVGIKVQAPAGMTAAELKNSVYQSNSGAGWSGDKSFWTNKDSADNDAAHYIGLWFPITPATVKQFMNEGRNMTYTYRFSWDGDTDNYEQLITFSVVPSDNIKLNAVAQTNFGFVNAQPGVQLVDTTLTNPVQGGNGDGSVTYESSDVNIATVDADGKVTFHAEGTVTIKATKAADQGGFYKEAVAEYTVTVHKNAQDEFRFEESSNTITVKYAVGKTVENKAINYEGAVPVYRIVSGTEYASIDPNTGVVTVLKPGTVIVEATSAATTAFEGKSIQYTLIIEKGDQTGFAIDGNAAVTLTYDKNLTYQLKVVNNLSGETLKYEIVSAEPTDVVSVNASGLITVNKAGTVRIKVTSPSNGLYNEAVVYFDLTVNKAAQPDFGFAGAESVSLVYNTDAPTYSQSIAGKLSSVAAVYRIVSGDAATVDPSTGTVTILKAGTVVVEVTSPEDACYLAASDRYTLTVTKAAQSFTFADGNAVTLLYGSGAYNNVISYAGNHGEGALTYTISDNAIGATINADGVVSFADSETKVGTVTVTVAKAEDDRYQSYSASYTLTVNYLPAPTEKVTLSGEQKNNSGWYTGNVTIAAPDGYKISYANELSTSDWADSVVHSIEGSNAPVIYLKDEYGHITDAITVDAILLDKHAPVDLKIGYSLSVWDEIAQKLFGFTPENVIVTLDSADATSGVALVEYSVDGTNYTKVEAVALTPNGSYSFTVAAQYRGAVTMRVTDVAGNVTELYADGKTLVVDSIAPGIAANISGKYTDIGGILYTKDDAFAVTFKVSDANYDLRAADPSVVVNDKVQSMVWTEAAGFGQTTLPLPNEGDYKISVDFNDRIHDAATYLMDVRVDKTAPVISVKYGNTDVKNTVGERKYYDAAQTVTITITEHNFRIEDVVVTVTADVDVMDYAAYAADTKNWKHDGDTHTLVLTFDADANYDLAVSCVDMLETPAQAFKAAFTVDTTVPENLNIDYSDSVVDMIINSVTFGYYNAEATVTLSANDAIAGLEYFVLNVKAEGSAGATDVELPKDLVISKDGTIISGTKGFVEEITAKTENGKVSLSFQVPAQLRGELIFSTTDLSGNTAAEYDDSKVVVVDTIAPDRTVAFEPTRIVAMDSMKDVQTLVEGDAVVLYYNKDAVATFTITEANFYAEDVVIKVNGQTVQVPAWNNLEGDTWQNTLTLTEEGDHVITMSYQDRSSNEMVTYTSQRIVIDKTAPVITVTYGNTNVKNTFGEREYFDAVQTATVVITEQNFRADDVKILVSAEDVLGNEVLELNEDGTVAAYAQQGADRSAWSAYKAGTWRRDDNTYILDLIYSADANYTFAVEYQDLAANAAADYVADSFTVDQTAPRNLQVSYSTSVLQQILESITFGFYNAEMTVTISATDDTTLINSFAYSYINSAGVSEVNAELLNQAIQESQISYSGSSATATFSIPRLLLDGDNQFNGTVRFSAYDRSGNGTQLSDNHRIVVDNIRPTATITFNAPEQENENVSYYAGDIQGTIVINEANFYASDVVVTVTKDGESYPVSVSWIDNSVDIHTGTFTLTEDGDYIVHVEYTDRSGNPMSSYVSKELTLDTTLPVVEVSDIVMNSANKDEVYGFTITVSDTNLDVATLKPVLTAVVRGENGLYAVQEIELGEAQAVAEGQTYSYTVENLPADAIYTLSFTVADMSGNMIDQVVLEDGESYHDVQFSVNRSGSTFGFGNAFTENLVDQYYIYSVDEDVVVVEVNVDPIETYAVLLNGKTLTEGSDYTTEQTNNAGEWSKRTYVISKDLFSEEGEYNIIVTSTDKTDTTAYSDVKDLSVAFVVDQTSPVITISGMETDGRYQTEAQTVTLIPSDEGGMLNSLKVILKNSNGVELEVCFDKAGQELLAYLEEHDGMVTFTIPTGLDQQVQIICDDYAVKTDGTTNVYDASFTRVTVSQNQFVIFYANRPLFFGTISGVLALIAMIVVLIKRRKSGKKENAKV